MIDHQSLALLASHPVSQLASQCLEQMGETPNPDQPALVSLVIAWMESQPQTGRKNFRPEMLDYAQTRLVKMSPLLAASYLVTDPESLDQQITQTDQSDRAAWTILSAHLTVTLHQAERRAEGAAVGPEAMGRVLEENLSVALQYQHPNFGQHLPSL